MEGFLKQEFDGIKITKNIYSGAAGAFEVDVDGELIHSKLTMGHGKCQSDAELDNIIDKVSAAVA